MSITRAEDFRSVRRLLVNPKEQCPDPDLIVNNQLAVERLMLNQANGQSAAWSVNTVSVSSVVDTAEYTITPNAGSTFGKTLFVYRDLGNNVLLPVASTDFLSELHNQKYEFWIAPIEASEIPAYSGEKVAFYRDGNTIKMRIYPIPEEERTYVVKYAAGMMDWTTFAWTDVPSFPEFADYRQALQASLTLDACQWEGNSQEENRIFRGELRNSLERRIVMFGAEWIPFIRNPQRDVPVGEIGYWWE